MLLKPFPAFLDPPFQSIAAINSWLPVFTRPEAVQIVFDSWRFLQRDKEFRLYGCVVLENYLHLIATAPVHVDAIKSFKMFTARQIIDLLERHQARVCTPRRTSRMRRKSGRRSGRSIRPRRPRRRSGSDRQSIDHPSTVCPVRDLI